MCNRYWCFLFFFSQKGTSFRNTTSTVWIGICFQQHFKRGKFEITQPNWYNLFLNSKGNYLKGVPSMFHQFLRISLSNNLQIHSCVVELNCWAYQRISFFHQFMAFLLKYSFSISLFYISPTSSLSLFLSLSCSLFLSLSLFLLPLSFSFISLSPTCT